jgi:nucleotide-binding universal stress UspA family protein
VLVVGVDGSPASWDAFEWAANEARRHRGRVIAVFAISPVDPELAMAFNVPLDFGATEDARTEMVDGLEGEVARRAGELGVDATFVWEHGDVAQALSRVAGAAHSEVIVLGRSERALHGLVGSLGDRLAHRNDLPVVVVVP